MGTFEFGDLMVMLISTALFAEWSDITLVKKYKIQNRFIHHSLRTITYVFVGFSVYWVEHRCPDPYLVMGYKIYYHFSIVVIAIGVSAFFRDVYKYFQERRG